MKILENIFLGAAFVVLSGILAAIRVAVAVWEIRKENEDKEER